MLNQRVIWTLLPRGRTTGGGSVQASILVSPRLRTSAAMSPSQLSKFPSWLDWPKSLSEAELKVRASTLTQPMPVKILSSSDSAVWTAIFGPDTPITPWVFDARRLVGRTILSYPVRTVANLVERVYGEIAIDAVDRPALPGRNELGRLLRDRVTEGKSANPAGQRDFALTPPREMLGLLMQESKSGDTAGAAPSVRDNPGFALDILNAYHTPLEARTEVKYPPGAMPEGYAAAFPGLESPYRHAAWETATRTPLPAPAEFDEIIDFHGRIAALMDYPELARLCGLVIDIEFEAPPTSPDLRLEVEAVWPDGGIATDPDITPATRAELTASNFAAAPRTATSPVAGRYLRLGSDTHSVVQMDVDGAGLKLTNTTLSLSRPVRGSYTDETAIPRGVEAEVDAGLPALRTGGLMLAQHRRDAALARDLARAQALETAVSGGVATPPLHAEDLVRGYRIDVRDLSDPQKQWRSLYARQTTVGFVNEPGRERLQFLSEGASSLAAGESADGANANIMKIHEALATWTGWSLAAPEPGRLVQADDGVGPDREEIPPGLPLDITHVAAKGTLPRLRFGHTYEMRVRLVDLAGNGAPVTDPEEAFATEPVTYTRHEPVTPASLALIASGGGAEPLDDGEAMARLAIRTFNDDITVAPPAAMGAPRRRHVIPPRVSQRFAEQHGVFDDPATGRPRADLYAAIVGRDPFAAPNPTQPSGATPPPGAPVSPIREIEIDRGKLDHTPERFAVADPDFAYSFLPDPLAVGVTIRIAGLPDIAPTQLFKVPLYPAGAKWPDVQSFKIELWEAGSTNSAQFDAGARAFRVALRKGERARLELRCQLLPERVASMAVFAMMQRHVAAPGYAEKILKGRSIRTASDLKAVAPRIADGDHWMFTPPRYVELVHAVQRPLLQPDIAGCRLERTRGRAEATFIAPKAKVDGKSTLKLDIEARWRDPIDDPRNAAAANGPVVQEASGPVLRREIARLETPGQVLDEVRGPHALPDTRARRIAYTATGTTRFGDYMPAALRCPEQENGPTPEPCLVEDKLTRSSAPAIAWAPNAAPPLPPEALYVIPTFGWSRSRSGDTSRSWRSGGGLRIYLARPWLTTGFTEMLGVVLADGKPSAAVFASRYAASATAWGGDPIRPGAAASVTSQAPDFSNFPLAKFEGPITWEGTSLPAEEGETPQGQFKTTGLMHPEFLDSAQNPLPLAVAPHQVGYDDERRLWYADIVVRPPDAAYFPFIRLALARYNPISLPGAHLSNIVLTDIQQLVPDRLVIVTRLDGGGRARVVVHGHGGTPRGAEPQIAMATGITSPRFSLEIQLLDAGADPDLGWRTVPEPPPQPTRAEAISPNRQVAIGPVMGDQRVLDRRSISRIRAIGSDLAMDEIPPPKLFEAQVRLPPAPSGGKRRLLVIEQEYYDQDPTPGAQLGARIIFIDTQQV